ncbi:hypothetical protein FACUT_9270 [Fusarium acutatum]|uniref:Fungal N-terminal domain-containing protein n=1 Tax=Fusarium acutatum TaxID=78861 RepID=A0A8H4JLN5_9HYPO|nr:hypothetical protein FACUT_9270 [Fusarium acutatum]
MDPASLSFGIVSLAMQLVQTAKAVKEYIAAYKSAAKELESLADKLDDIETICCALEIILSDGIQRFTTLEVNLLQKLSRIIEQCLSKVSEIHGILDTISRMQKNTRNPLKTTPRVIYLLEGQRQIGEKVEMAFMDDNLGQIQDFFTQGILTPATVIAWDEYDPDNETSLLGLAALTKSKSILRFLATQTFDLPNRNHVGSAKYLYAIGGEDGPRCVLEYINIRQHLIMASEFHMILRGIEDPYNAQICVEACKPHFSSNMVAFNTAVWRYAMKQFKHGSTVNIEGWANLIAGCISRGLDIYQQLRYVTDFSALKDILFYNWDTEEIMENVHRWIDILEEAGVRIKEYLMVETECCFATWRDVPYWNNKKNGPSNYRRTLFITESRGRQFPFWAFFIQDECPVRELLTEHENFASPLTLYHAIGSTQAYIAQHQAWKEHQTLGVPDGSDRNRKGWPFWLPLRCYDDHNAKEAEWVDRELQLAQSRFERRQRRQERKTGLHRQNQRMLMPGTWVEDV